MNIAMEIISLLALVLWGYLFANLFNISNIEKLGLSYLLGTGIVTFLLFVFYYLFGARFTLLNSLSLYVASFVLLVFTNKKLHKINSDNLKIKFITINRVEKLLLLVIFTIFLSVIVSGLYSPITSWDSLSLYDYRSRELIATGGFESMGWWSYYYSYPLLTSLSQYWMYLFGATTAMPYHSFLYVFFVIASFGLLKRHHNTKYSLLFSLFIASAPNLFLHGHLAYTNLPYTANLAIGIIYLNFFFNKNKYSDLIIGALLVGLSTWSRTVDPFWIIPLVAIVSFSVIRRKFYSLTLYSIIFFAIMLPWRSFQLVNANITQTNYVNMTVSETKKVINKQYSSNDLINVFNYLQDTIVKYYQEFIIISVLLMLRQVQKKESKNLFIPIFIVGSFAILYGGTLVFYHTQSYWNEIPDSVRRMFLFFPPVSIFYLAYSFKNKLKYQK